MAEHNPAEMFDRTAIATALNIERRSVARRAVRENWPYTEVETRGGKRRLYRSADLPDDVALKLQRRYAPIVSTHPAQQDPTYQRGYGEVRHVTEAERAEAWAYWARLKDTRKAVANERMFALREVLDLRAAGVGKMQARAQVGEMRGVSVATLTRWEAMVGDAPRSEWLALLVERKKGHSGRTPWAQCEDVVWRWYKSYYLSEARPTHAEAFRRATEMAHPQGWAIPSAHTLKRRMNKEVPRTSQILLREGPQAVRGMLPTQTRDVMCFAPGVAVNGDGLKLDRTWIRFKDGERLKSATVWNWQDIYSRKMLAWRIGKTESTDLFRLATYDLTAVCAPRQAWMDNTRAAANKTMTAGAKGRHRFKSDPEDGLGLLLMLGIEPEFTNPDKWTGNPGAKPIERAFGIGGIHEEFLKHPKIIAAGGGRTKETALDIDLVNEVFAEEVARFNARLGRKTQMCRGELSFDQAWAQGLEGHVPRVLTVEQRRLLLLSREVVTAHAKSGQVWIKAGRGPFGRNGYWSEALAQYAGQKVVVLYDPENLSADAQVYTLAGDVICTAEHLPTQAFNNTHAGREHSKFRRRKARSLLDVADSEARMDALEMEALYGAAVDVGSAVEAVSATTGAGEASGATEAGGARVVQGHFQKTPGRARRRNAGGAPGAVVAFPEGIGRGQDAARAAADAERRRAMEEYTERVLAEKLAGVL